MPALFSPPVETVSVIVFVAEGGQGDVAAAVATALVRCTSVTPPDSALGLATCAMISAVFDTGVYFLVQSSELHSYSPS